MQGMARIKDVVFDCSHPASLARFWAAALDDFDVAPYDAAELERLRLTGVDDPEDDPQVLVESRSWPIRLFFQKVPEPRLVKNRVHIDVTSDDADAERQRLIELGATVDPVQPAETFIVMHDPEGNEFCLMR
jgi:hypothetical protein